MEEEFEGRIKTNHELGTMSNIHCIPDEVNIIKQF
jgi:hypothetical protein